MTTLTASEKHSDEHLVSPRMTLLLAVACGMAAANLYYAQPLAGPISAALHLSPQATGLIVTLTQLGFGAGMVLIVPLGDLVENRRLVLIMLAISALALLCAAVAPNASLFLTAALLIGFGSVAVHVLVPYAAHMAPAATRGVVVGNVMSGLLLGVMLARPVSSFIAEMLSWQAVFVLSALAMIVLALALGLAMPRRMPQSKLTYGELLISLGRLAATTPILQRRALYHGLLGGAFSLFWTTVPLVLAGPQFQLSQAGIGLFALAGVAGAIAAPLGGRFADHGWGRLTTACAMLLVALAFLIAHVTLANSMLTIAVLVAAAVLLDFGVSANMSVGQRMIFALTPEFRGRFNGVYTVSFFIGGAIGSALGGWAYAVGGWPLAEWVGLAFPLIAFAVFTTE